MGQQLRCLARRARSATINCWCCHRLHPIWIKAHQLKNKVLVDPEIMMEEIVLDPAKRPRLGYAGVYKTCHCFSF